MSRLASISRVLPGCVLVLFLSAHSVNAAEKSVSVLELFTSHGCSSCPPAEKLFNELLSEDDALIGLEFHVDYWNSLVHGGDGNWVDPFSQPEFSVRQQNYNRLKLSGRKGVYTPQAIINGRFAAVGSDSRRIRKRLRVADKDMLTVNVVHADGSLAIDIAASVDQNANVWLVHYIDAATTAITSGENKNLNVTNHNIVTAVQAVGPLTQGQNTYTVDYTRENNTGCAVLVQSVKLGPILGAARCH